MKPGRHRLPAIILGRVNLGEADLIVRFFTREFGLLSGMAKHGRRSHKRFGNVLTPSTVAELALTATPNRELVRLDSGEIIRSFDHLGASALSLAQAGLLLELTTAFCAPEDPAPDIFLLLVWGLERLDLGHRPEETLPVFIFRLLDQTGFGPDLEACASCGRPIGITGGVFTVNPGGLLCPICLPNQTPVSPGTLKTMALIRTMPREKLDRLRFGERSRLEAESFLLSYVRHLLGRELKSLKVMEQLTKAGRNQS